MNKEEQIIYDEIIKLITENKFLSINGTPMTLNEVNNYITNLQQENKQLKDKIDNVNKYIDDLLEKGNDKTILEAIKFMLKDKE